MNVGRNIYVTEKQFNDFVNFSIKKYGKIKCNIYRKKLPNGYGKYIGKDVGLPFDVYLKENGGIKNVLICYLFDNDKQEYRGYEVRYNNKIGKTKEDEYMRLFINNNIELLYNLSNGICDFVDFLNEVVTISDFNKDEERSFDINLLNEMATISSRVTGLKTDLWVDENGSYKKGKHWQRIKFNPQNDVDKDSRQYPSMTIEDEPKIFKKYSNQQINLNSRDIEKIKLFIKLNKERLLLMGDGKLNKSTEFIPLMATFDKEGIKLPITNTDFNNYKVNFTDEYGFDQLILFDKQGRKFFNFTKSGGNGVPYCKFWFDKLTGFFTNGQKLLAQGTINNNKYLVDTNGVIQPIR